MSTLVTTITAAPVESPGDGELRVEPVDSSDSTVCAMVSLDNFEGRFCSLRAGFTWSLGDRVFLFYVGPDLQLQDGRVLVRAEGEKFVVHEIRDETVDNPIDREPSFCSVILIAEAFRRYAPQESFGWGGGTCMSEEFWGVGTIPGVDEAGIGEVLGGSDGTDRFVGFVARLDGVWTVLELVPGDQMLGCESVSVPVAKDVCDHSVLFKDEATAEP